MLAVNSDKKLLVIGATGLIGRNVAYELNRKFAWIGTAYSKAGGGYLKCDIMDPENVADIFNTVKPTHVIHCAQLAGGLDFYEKNPELANKFHFGGTVNLARECLKHGAKLIFISSECVFDGGKNFYNENDAPNPGSIYGKYKAESERWISQSLNDYLIIRSMSVFGWDPLTETPNAIMNAYFSISSGQRCVVSALRWGTPTYVKDLAKAIVELSSTGATGIYHVAGATFVNRYDWLKKTCDALGWDSSLLTPKREVSCGLAFRPLKIGLDTKKFRENFKTKLHSLDESLELMKEDIANWDKVKVV